MIVIQSMSLTLDFVAVAVITSSSAVLVFAVVAAFVVQPLFLSDYLVVLVCLSIVYRLVFL